MQQISKYRSENSLDCGQARRRLAGEQGATFAEYALLVVLIAIPVSVVMPGLATAISTIFQLLAAAF